MYDNDRFDHSVKLGRFDRRRKTPSLIMRQRASEAHMIAPLRRFFLKNEHPNTVKL
jgi:hypothetical protein